MNFLIICFKSWLPVSLSFFSKTKRAGLSRPLRKPRHTHRERRCSITSLHLRVKCAGTLQSFWLLVVCRLTGWRQRVGSWMMLEKQTIRHVTNTSQRKPSGYVPLSLSLFFIFLSIRPIFARQFMLAKNRLDVVRLWLQFLFVSGKKKYRKWRKDFKLNSYGIEWFVF